MKSQYSLYLSAENEAFFKGGRAKNLDDFLTYLRDNNLTLDDAIRLLSQDNYKSTIKLKHIVSYINKWLEQDIKKNG